MMHRLRQARLLRRPLLPLLGILVLVPGEPGATSVEREQFRRAYSAYLDGDAARAESLSKGLEGYSLYPHLQYEAMRRRLDKPGGDINAVRGEVRRFLEKNSATNVGERLRSQWLSLLARQQRWADFLADFAPQESTALRCAHFTARMATGATTTASDALATEARELWLTGASLPAACAAVDDWLGRRGYVTTEIVRERFDLAIGMGNTTLAMQLARALPEADAKVLKLWDEVQRKPSRHLANVILRKDTPLTRAVVRSGIEQMARVNAGKANTEWMQRRDNYDYRDEEKAIIAANIAIAAVRQGRADALQLLDKAPSDLALADLQRARLMAALSKRDWKRIEKWTTQPAAVDMEASSWRYWRARALQELGMKADAEALFREIAAERDYYGLMAAEILGIPYDFSHRSSGVSRMELERFLEKPGVKRARELRELGFDTAARQEWNFEIGKLDRQDLIEAAVAAHSLQWHERAIATLGKAKAYDDLDIRYPIAYESIVGQYAQERNLEPAVMLSFIRSESAFNDVARSPAGALGLMQVMPATGRATARQLGLTRFSTSDLLKPLSNVMIGSAYLRDMLDEFDGNLAMAAAAYNAGPHRVRKWRPVSHCIDADVWVDTIPFTETRRYARNILFGTALYQMRLKEKIRPLRDRVRVVNAQNVNAASCKTG